MTDAKGRLLGIDPGTKRIGFAISDDMQWTCRPLEVWTKRSDEKDLARVKALVDEHEVVGLIVGVPYRLDGSESDSTRRALKWVALLREAFPNLEIVERDEALTTVEAAERMRALGIPADRALIDAYAAAVILQDELASRGEGEPDLG